MKKLYIVLFAFFLAVLAPITIHATPHSVPVNNILLRGVKGNATLTYKVNGEERHPEAHQILWEKWYTIYLYGDLDYDSIISLEVKDSNGVHTFTLNHVESGKDGVFLLNLQNDTITYGKPLSRTLLLVVLRTMVHILIAFGVFTLFGFKTNKSRVRIVLGAALIYGVLNSIIDTNGFNEYSFAILIVTPIQSLFASLACLLLFGVLLNERRVPRRLASAAAAGVANIFVTQFLITHTPI